MYCSQDISYFDHSINHEDKVLKGRIDQLVKLDESRRQDFDQMERNRDKVKGVFDHKER
jgi:hypothetical protein